MFRFRHLLLVIMLVSIVVLLVSTFIYGYVHRGDPMAVERPARSGVVSHSSDAPGHPPGPADVSTTTPGRQFQATPNFYNFAHCLRPCWLPTYAEPRLVLYGSYTDGYPQERLGAYGDSVLVVCQVHGQAISNDAGVSSDIWDRLAIPRSRLDTRREQLPRTIDQQWFFTYGSDLYLGNTGWHHLPCP